MRALSSTSRRRAHACPAENGELTSSSFAFSYSALQYLKNEWDSSLFIAEKVYGTHAAWEKRMDKAVLSQIQRLPGAPSSHALLDSYLGRDDKIEVEDILNCEYLDFPAIFSKYLQSIERAYIVSPRPPWKPAYNSCSCEPVPGNVALTGAEILCLVLAVPEMRARAPRSTVHDQMERKLGLQ